MDISITSKERKQIIRLLGKLQGFLESSIDCMTVKGTDECSPHDRLQLASDQKLWCETEDVVLRLEQTAPAQTQMDWDEGGRVHNWKNHVGENVRAIWHTLSDTQRAAVKADAENKAADEDWD